MNVLHFLLVSNTCIYPWFLHFFLLHFCNKYLMAITFSKYKITLKYNKIYLRQKQVSTKRLYTIKIQNEEKLASFLSKHVHHLFSCTRLEHSFPFRNFDAISSCFSMSSRIASLSLSLSLFLSRLAQKAYILSITNL